MNRRDEFLPWVTARVWVLALALFWLCVLYGVAHAATNLPQICTKPVTANSCGAARSFNVPTADTPVTVQSGASYQWALLKDVPDTASLAVCPQDIVAGTLCPVANTYLPKCQAVACAPPVNTLPGTFTVTPTVGANPVSVVVAWDTPGAVSCLALGTGWSGAKAKSGSETVAITDSKTFAIVCDGPAAAPSQATLSWKVPTQRIDNSPLTTLAGYKILYGLSPTALTTIIDLPDATKSNYVIMPLGPATWFFAIKAYTSTGKESALSSVVSKTITGSPALRYAASADVSVDALPKPPADFTVTISVAVE